MAFFNVEGIGVKGIVSTVPKEIGDNLNDENIPKEKGQKILDSTGIRYRRLSRESVTTSDLCEFSAVNLLENKKIDRSNIEVVVFLSQTPDYVLPATSTILQHKLGLPNSALAFDINLGCSGFVYGLSVVTSLLEKIPNPNASALLLVGDTSSKLTNKRDLSTYPLFGDCGTATLLTKEKGAKITFDLFSDGKGWDAIRVDHGAFRKQISKDSEELISNDGVNFRRERDLYLNGMDVFSFGITKVPKAVKDYYEKTNLSKEDFDFFIFHQANMFMNEKIRKKLKLEEEKVPYTLYDYANTSSATIPLTLTTKLKDKIKNNTKILACGFGVGLSWGIAQFEINKKGYFNTIEYDDI